MRSRVVATTLLTAAALIGALASQAQAAPALPLPLPVAATEPLVTEVGNVEGPLFHNVNLATPQ
ncbi:hypothetical protein G5C60_49515 [Streptomyces sp. HC44]|uniref:Secreted protein n=1 Tax=Streptomyces scabichelini TaxID=2711217 RepID=A0A6G4VML4_9ACTN|nr:hypothetical protein [Streptomyces scabichelini]NGO15412.1 hypothetical protein [Streptomyces scabichelini]